MSWGARPIDPRKPLTAMRDRGYRDGKAGRVAQTAFQTDVLEHAYADGYRLGAKHRVSSQT